MRLTRRSLFALPVCAVAPSPAGMETVFAAYTFPGLGRRELATELATIKVRLAKHNRMVGQTMRRNR
jgi:hypothetical protein